MIENFSTTTYKDPSTTAIWDTNLAQLNLGSIMDSYSESYQNSYIKHNEGNNTKSAMSFTGDGNPIRNCTFYLSKVGLPTGNAIATVYAHTGTFGSSSKPTGSVLATSNNFDVTTLTSSYSLVTFTFPTPLATAAGTNYCIVFEYAPAYPASDASNYVRLGDDTSAEATAGNWAYFVSGTTWSAQAAYGVCFYINKEYLTTGFGQSSTLDSTSNITSASIAVVDSTPVGTSIGYQLSNDGGVSWETVVKDIIHYFTSSGSDLRFKITLNGTRTETPYVDSITTTVRSVNLTSTLQTSEKNYFIKIYQPNGDYITSYQDFDFQGFRKQINGGLGELSFSIARKFDDFDENSIIKLNNKVELWCSDGDTPSTGLKIYSGFISQYEPSIQEHTENVTVRCLGYVSKLATSILKNGSQIELKTDTAAGLTTGASASATEVVDVVTAIIDRYRIEANNPQIDHDTLDDSGQTMTYTFNGKFYNEALAKCLQGAPANWWWYIGADNLLQFKAKPTTPKHIFTFGKDFKNIKVEKNMESVLNNVLFSNNSTILKRYSDATSIDDFDDRWEILTDERVLIEATADNIGNSEIGENKDADARVIIEVADNNGTSSGYDIESINPGDTCKFVGFNDITSQTFNSNMQILGVQYTPDSVVLEIESLKPSIARELNDTNKRLEEQESTNRLNIYT